MRKCLVHAAAFALLFPATAAAQTPPNVARDQSAILLDMPGLANGREVFQYLGWNDRFSVEHSYASQVAARADYPRAQVSYYRLTSGFYWRYSVLDEAWIRRFNFFKERKLELTKELPGPSSDYLSTIRFRVDGSDCVGFSMRSVAMGVEGGQSAGTPAFEGLYCGAAGEALSDDTVRAAIAGVYFRDGGKLRRAYGGDARPIPERLLRSAGS
jgi:hypothetical protein